MKTNTEVMATDANYEMLAQAIVEQAVHDYIGAILRQKKPQIRRRK